MSSANINEIKKWPILNVLEPELQAQIRIALVYGQSGDKAIIVTEDDKVYAFGNKKNGSLGLALNASTFLPIEVESLSGKGVIKFAIGSNILALTKSGQVYCCYTTNFTPIPELLEQKVMDVACGVHHSLALTDGGEVYLWGDEIKDEAGKYVRIKPTKLSSQFEDDKIVSITSELESILALTRTGVVCKWTRWSHSLKDAPKRVEDLVDIVKLVSGTDHTMALSKEGSLYIWGSNSYGQFGNGSSRDGISSKVKSQLVGHVVDIAAGEFISAAVNKRGQVYMWGRCCTQTILIPTSVPLSNVDDVILHFSSCKVMRESRVFHKERETSLLECMTQNFNNPVTSDLIIKVQDEPIHVHKAILKLRSAHFKIMFNGEWKEKNQSIIEQNQYSWDVYKAFLQYLYTDNVDASPDQVLELKKLANQYFDIELEEVCNRIILQNKKRESTSNVYELKKWPILNLLDSELITQVRKAFIFGSSGNKAIIITEDDEVYGLGDNANGCLGIGIRTNTIHATEIEVLSGKGVIKFAVDLSDYPSHVLALTRTGQVYSWGYNSSGGLGIGSVDNQWDPVLITHELHNKEVIDIACGHQISLALTNEGKVYQWGYNAFNRPAELYPKYKSCALFNNEKIKSIAGMSYLIIAETEFDQIYFWGRDFDPSTNYTKSTTKFDTPKKIERWGEPDTVKIVAGSYHILALSKEGSLNIWGYNTHGEIGCGNICNDFTFYKMPKWIMGPIADIAAGPHISAALNQNGEVFMWGLCLGQNISMPTRTEFSNIFDVLLHFSTTRGTNQLLELPKKDGTSVLESLEQGFDDSTTTDLVVMVQDKPIHVHKIILQLRSSYCERMFKEDWAGTNPIIIQDEYSHEVYTSFFKYLYTERVDVTPANLSGLMDLAIRFSDTRLMNLCAHRIETIQRYKCRNFASYNHFTCNK